MIKRTPPSDRDKVKIASFRISEGEWYDFSEEADRQNVTATDVIKKAIRNFMAGDFAMPAPVEPPVKESGKEWTATEIERVVSTAGYIRIDETRSIVATAIDEAIAPIQLDLAELLGQVDELRVSIEGKTQASKQGAIEEPKPIATGSEQKATAVNGLIDILPDLKGTGIPNHR
jgi:hypothetical protein